MKTEQSSELETFAKWQIAAATESRGVASRFWWLSASHKLRVVLLLESSLTSAG